MYYGSFLSIGNLFGETAACFLARGYAQGAPPSPFLFEITYDPFPTLIRALQRGCTVEALENPSGSSPFADDMVLHSDGPDAISAMRVMVDAGGAYLQWLGLFVNMQKSYICAVNLADGRPVATDSITLHGSPFRVLLPDAPHKHLGVRMTVLGDFHAEKVHVREEMNRRIDSLLSDLILTPSMKEYAFKTSIVSVFRYSAGLVPWSLNELLEINAMWSNAYTRFWWRRKSARGIDASPILLSNTDGGRDCPSAIEEWTREVLTLYDQCLFLPGEVARVMRHHLYQTCLDHFDLPASTNI